VRLQLVGGKKSGFFQTEFAPERSQEVGLELNELAKDAA